MDLYQTSYGTNATVIISHGIHILVQIFRVLYQHYLTTGTMALQGAYCRDGKAEAWQDSP